MLSCSCIFLCAVPLPSIKCCRPVCVITLSRPENDAFPATKKQSTRIDREGRREVREHASRFQAKHLFPGAVHEKPLRKRERVKEGSRQAHKRYWILRPGPGRTKESFLAPSARLRGTWRVRCSGCLDFFCRSLTVLRITVARYCSLFLQLHITHLTVRIIQF
jgi:hypothetical protein